MRFGVVVALACGLLVRAQAPTPSNGSTREAPPLFRTSVELVMIPVVARDAQGRAVGTLKAEDFTVLDRGKPQTISRFSVERSLKAAPDAHSAEGAAKPAPGPLRPQRFVGYLFDDIHSQFGDLARVRDAAWEHMQGLAAEDRAAVYSTSGQTSLAFTDDREKLHAALLTLVARPLAERNPQDCPDLSPYQAEMIRRGDSAALGTAISEAFACGHLSLRESKQAELLARIAASRVSGLSNRAARAALETTREVVRKMSAAPGRRVLLLASSGFLATERSVEKNDLIDRAIRAGVIINALDARGLWADSVYDAGRPFKGNAGKLQFERAQDLTSGDVLAEIALGTGGKFFESSNDLADGFRRLADTPEYLCLIGFAPKDVKADGSFHPLTVSVTGQPGLTVLARRGYFAPKERKNPERAALEELREAAFAREETCGFPLELTAGFATSGEGDDELKLIGRIKLSDLRFREESGRRRNNLTIIGAVFDRNGNYVAGDEGSTTLDFPPEVFANPAAFVSVRQNFRLKPGSYFVRMVVRDSEDHRLAAVNAGVDAP